jgi:capsular polysaccharide transport system permease protein
MRKRTSLTIFTSVIRALFLREIQTRFGSQSMGYFWAIFDAMFMVLIFAGLRSAISKHDMNGVDFPVFLASGFLAFYLWKNIISKSLGAFSSNKALFNYVQVKPIDTLITRFIIEVLVSSIATVVFLAIGLYFGYDISVYNFNMVMLAVTWFALFGFAIGLFGAVVGTFYQNFVKILNIIISPMMFISAIMYTVDSLPPVLQQIILYNPVVHFMEMIHGYYFSELTTRFIDYQYMFYWTFIPLFFGLYFYKKAEKKIIASR